MGADQIGFLVIGPQKLDKSKIDEAVEEAVKIGLIVKNLIDEYDKENNEEAVEKLWEELKATGIDLCSDEPHDYEKFSYDSNKVKKEAEDFIDNWPMFGRDTAYRLYKDKVIVYAGEMSWGDEPNGYGYEALKYACDCGWFEIFGIE